MVMVVEGISDEQATHEIVGVQKLPPNCLHKVARIKINGNTMEDPELALTPGELGLNRLTTLTVTPIGHFFGVAWNGNTRNPTLRFDGWPGSDFEVEVQAWGFP